MSRLLAYLAAAFAMAAAVAVIGGILCAVAARLLHASPWGW
jgi:hypothetical protein